jgi:UDP-N-acetyl-D-glucosamine dehydrogenase
VKDRLIERLRAKTAVIAIIGLGYVGLPLVLRFAEAGFRVIGFDIDREKVDRLMRGESYIEHISGRDIREALDAGFEASADLACVTEADAIILCVPTPLNKYREPDLSYVLQTVESILPHLREGQLVSLESTTYPGTSEEELKPRLEQAGLRLGESGFLVYSPEREDPGNASFTTRTIPKVVGGITPACLEAGVSIASFRSARRRWQS